MFTLLLFILFPQDDEDDQSDYDETLDNLADGDDFEDNSDLESISAERQNSDSDDEGFKNKNKSKKNKRGAKRGGDSDEEGQISRVSKKMEARAASKKGNSAPSEKPQTKRKFDKLFDSNASRIAERESRFQERSSSGGRGGRDNNSKSSRGGPKMYEISEGTATSTAVFGHTDESRNKRKEQKQLAVIPLSERLQKEFGEGSKGAARQKDKITYVKTAEEGLVRELSYVPFEDRSGKGVKRSADKLSEKTEKKGSKDGGRVEKFEGSNKNYMRSGGSERSSSSGGGRGESSGRGGGRGRGGSGRGGGRGGGGGGGRGGGRGGGGRGRR